MLRSVWTPNCRMGVALELLSVQEDFHKALAGIHDANAGMARQLAWISTEDKSANMGGMKD